jgi:hypothetical protein
MKPATKLAIKAAVRMNKIAKDVGVQRKREENQKRKAAIESAIGDVKNTLIKNDSILQSLDKELPEVSEKLKIERGVIRSGIIEGDDLKQFIEKEAIYSKQRAEIKSDIKNRRMLKSANEQRLVDLEKKLGQIDTQDPREQKNEGRTQRVEQAQVSMEQVPAPSAQKEELRDRVDSQPAGGGGGVKADSPRDIKEEVEPQRASGGGGAKVDLPVQPVAVKSSERVVISEATKKELLDYLETINKTMPIALKLRGKELEKRANDLSDKLDFFNYMGVVSSDSKCKDSFKGILKERVKANVMLVQLQKTLQKEMGTYNKEYDKKLIKSEEKLNEEIEYYAKNNKLDADQLAKLMSEVSTADTKTRVEKTSKLISYMIK